MPKWLTTCSGRSPLAEHIYHRNTGSRSDQARLKHQLHIGTLLHRDAAPCLHLHRDDVADHEQLAQHFGCPRVLHELEVTQATAGVEVKLRGVGPWSVSGQPLPLSSGQPLENRAGSGGGGLGDSNSRHMSPSAKATVSDSKGPIDPTAAPAATGEDVVLVLTPGHTRGHVCLYHAPTKTLFSGAQTGSQRTVEQSHQTLDILL